MITEFNEKGHPMVFSDEAVNTEQLKEKCIKAIESLSWVHGAAERKAEACFRIALSELENNWKQRSEAAEAKLAELEKQEPRHFYREHNSYNGMKTDWTEVSAEQLKHLKEIIDPETAEIIELFTRPAPAVSLAEMVPPEADGSNLPFAANGWNACRAAILRNIEETK